MSATGLHDPLRREATYIDLVLWSLVRWPDHEAFIEGARTRTYSETRAEIFRLARALQDRGFGKGDGIVVLSGNRADALLASLAIRVLGGWSAALHPLGSSDDDAYIVSDCGARGVVYDPTVFDERAREIFVRVDTVRDRLALGESRHGDDLLSEAARCPATPVPTVAEIDDLCTITYSGGTTGRPKGVVQRHRVAVEMTRLIGMGWQLPEDLRFLATTPISHAASCFVLPTLLSGGTVVLHGGFEPAAFCELVRRHRITATFIVPTMLYVLLDHPALSAPDLASLQTVVYGAAPMSPQRLQAALELLGPIFLQLYGQSEAPATVTALRKEEHDPARPHLFASCGKPLPGVTVGLLDDNGAPVAVGEVGEICVRGAIVSDGYWQLPELTAETFRDEWLHTGDLARADDEGYLYIVDRKKDMIISGGFNVYPREVEDVICTHPGVASCVVIGVPDERWGEAVKALVVGRPGGTPPADEIIALVRKHKGAVCAPKTVDFLDTLPLTALGKPDRKALRAKEWSGMSRQIH